jgi:O-antigen/teichoic acid export membrane protein
VAKQTSPQPTKSHSFWAIADQGIASAGNFATSLFLARALPPAEFGTFVLLNSACLVAFGLQGNLIVSPLVVLGASGSATRISSYLTAALLFTLALVPISALFVLPAAASLHRVETGGLALVYLVAWQLQEATRRALLSSFRYADAIWGDAVSYLGQAALIALLWLYKSASLDVAFAMMAATSVVAAAVQSWQARLAPASLSDVRNTGIRFWALGKWLGVVSLLTLGQGPIFPWFLNWFHGRSAAADFQAAMNVCGLVNPVINSIPAIVIPAAAAFLLTDENQSRKKFFEFGMKHIIQMEILLAPVFIVIGFWPQTVLAMFYGKHSVYVHQALALRIGALVFILTVPMTVFGAMFTGAERTKDSVKMNGIGTFASLLFGPFFIYAGGAVGAMCAEIATRLARVIWAARFITPNVTVSPTDLERMNCRA